MKTVTTRPAAQGDILIIPAASIPADAKPATAENGQYVIAHSETGHHHVVEAHRAEVFEAADDSFVAFIRSMGAGAEIVHKRNFHTHETIAIPPNTTVEIRRQREYVAEGFRRAAD